jgi:hypothetical protein
MAVLIFRSVLKQLSNHVIFYLTYGYGSGRFLVLNTYTFHVCRVDRLILRCVIAYACFIAEDSANFSRTMALPFSRRRFMDA